MHRIKQNTTWVSSKKIERNWYVFDIKGKNLGRAATEIASLLSGKNDINNVSNLDQGNFVIILNSKDYALSSDRKLYTKKYHSHSGYPKGAKDISLAQLKQNKPKKVVWKSVYGMLPNNKYRKRYISRLKLMDGASHPYELQKPQVVN